MGTAEMPLFKSGKKNSKQKTHWLNRFFIWETSEDKKGTYSCCPECQIKIIRPGNFCPHCGHSLTYQNDSQNDATHNEEPRQSTGFKNFPGWIKKRFSGFSYSTKSLTRKAAIVSAIYFIISLLYGGDPFRKLNERFYDAVTYASDASYSISETLSGVLIACRENLCPFVDSLADISDELGVIHTYIASEKTAREKEGEAIAESIIRANKSYESRVPDDNNDHTHTRQND
jgi:hypothetical protein